MANPMVPPYGGTVSMPIDAVPRMWKLCIALDERIKRLENRIPEFCPHCESRLDNVDDRVSKLEEDNEEFKEASVHQLKIMTEIMKQLTSLSGQK
ncbi:MAG: hypothetical protein WC222_02585 [Parachlamydiales bacterium]|jgi:hypothetical protein